MGIRYLEKFPSLEFLDLCNSLLTEEGVKELSSIKFKKLKSLQLCINFHNLAENNISKKGREIAEEIQILQNINVYYDKESDEEDENSEEGLQSDDERCKNINNLG